MLPENLYSSDNYSEITCSEIQLDLRNLDVYMGNHMLFFVVLVFKFFFCKKLTRICIVPLNAL